MSPTLEELENDVWDVPRHDSYLVTTCHRLRTKPIEDFTVEDFRIMIGQGIGLAHLLPRALDVLEQCPLAEGDFYPGDLLCAVTRSEQAFLEANRKLADRISAVAETALAQPEFADKDLKQILQEFVKHWSR